MLNEKQIRNAAVELQDLLGCEPPLNSKADIDDLTPELRKAITLLTPDDKLSKDTQQVVKELGEKPKAKAKEEVEEPEEEEKNENDALIDDINAAERLRDLKDIASEYDEFKSIRGKVSSYKTVDDLREAMLAILENTAQEEVTKEEPVTEEEPEEEVKPKAKEKKEKPVSDKPKRPAPPRKEGPQTEFGHNTSSAAGKIDEYIIKNKGKVIAISDVAEAVGTNNGRVKAHIQHLITKKGIKLDLVKGEEGYTVKYSK